MAIKRQLFRLVLATHLFAGASSAAPAPSLATKPALTFFSSLTEEPLARLEAAAIAPKYTEHGPFRVPAPGVAIESPVLTLHDQPCTPEDWTRVLQDLAAWRRLSPSADFLLTLPDSRAFVFIRRPVTDNKSLSGLVRPLGSVEPGSPKPVDLTLSIVHDGADRLRIDLRPLPARATYLPAPEAENEASPAPAPITTESPES